MNNNFRDKMTTVRINSKLLEEFKQTVNLREKNYYKKTSLADLLEKAIKNYLFNSDK